MPEIQSDTMETAAAEAKTQPPVPVTITVLRAHDLRGVRGDAPVTYLRSEFNNVLLGDSPKLEATPEKPTDYNFTSSFDLGGESPHSLDDVVHKPVILTAIEILPKEKKQKEEKTSVLGQASVDLLPLLRGECNFKMTVPLYPVPGSLLDARPDAKASLEVAVSVPAPLLAQSQIRDGNLLRVTVESAFCVPESWNPTGPQFNYVTSLQIPVKGERDLALIFSNGALKAGGQSEPITRQKRWPASGISAPGAQNIPKSFILGQAYEEEDGEMTGKEDKEFRAEAETQRKRVTWDIERRCYLDPPTAISLQKRIAECRFWPVEIMRAPLSATGKSKPNKAERQMEDEGQVSFHGVAYVNMVPLLYPGVTRLRGAYRVFPYQESEVMEKTKCQSSVLREVLRQNSLMSKVAAAPQGLNSPHPKQAPSRLGIKERDSSRKMSAVQKATEGTESDPTAAPTPTVNMEGQQYLDSRTYVVLEVALEKPLVPKRMAEEMDLKVKELVPARPQLDRRTAGAQKAVTDYHNQVTSITSAILEEYCQLFGPQMPSPGVEVDPHVLEEQKCQLNYELNCSGKYFAFKEQLKHAVVKIVREKYLRTTAFEDREQLQAFLSDLYIYLVDQMHVSLNKNLFGDREEAPDAPMADPGQLLRFAKEAEIMEDYGLAEMYYQERLARDRQSVHHWLDYGSFKLLVGDYIKAQECFTEALHLHYTHTPSLLLCGVAAALMDRVQDAEVFFEDATCVDAGSALAWTMLGLLYEIQGNDIHMEMAFSEARKLHQAEMSTERTAAPTDQPESARTVPGETGSRMTDVVTSPRGQSEAEDLSGAGRPPEQNSPPKSASSVAPKSKADSHRAVIGPSRDPAPRLSSIFMEAAEFLAQVNATQFVQKALAHELLCPEGGASCRYHLMCARMHLLRREHEAANEHLQKASEADHQDPDVWALTGHLRYLSGRKGEARECYERTLSLVADASEMHPVFLRLGSIYLQEGEYEKAKDTYLRACKRSPTCLTWLGAGIASYRLEDMQDAEVALSEANALNNRNAEVWGYLALVCLKTGRQLEAEQSYKYTMKLNLQNQTLLTEIHQLQEEVGFGDPSF